MAAVSPGDLVYLLVVGSGRRRGYLFRADEGAHYSTFAGPVAGRLLVGAEWGSSIELPGGKAYVLPPSGYDLMMHAYSRAGQVIYPKDQGFMAAVAGLRPGMRVLEAGVGSGFLTTMLASVVGCEGRVIGYDVRPEALRVAGRNLSMAGLAGCVELRLGDVRLGVPERGLDAIFLDMPDPWEALKKLHPSVRPGAPAVVFVPTYNQVERTAIEVEDSGWVVDGAFETLLREIEVRPGAVRPHTQMVGHTGFILLLRRVATT